MSAFMSLPSSVLRWSWSAFASGFPELASSAMWSLSVRKFLEPLRFTKADVSLRVFKSPLLGPFLCPSLLTIDITASMYWS